jgi:hypothetical protein
VVRKWSDAVNAKSMESWNDFAQTGLHAVEREAALCGA